MTDASKLRQEMVEQTRDFTVQCDDVFDHRDCDVAAPGIRCLHHVQAFTVSHANCALGKCGLLYQRAAHMVSYLAVALMLGRRDVQSFSDVIRVNNGRANRLYYLEPASQVPIFGPKTE